MQKKNIDGLQSPFLFLRRRQNCRRRKALYDHIGSPLPGSKSYKTVRLQVSTSLSTLAISGAALLPSSPAFAQSSNTVTATVPVGSHPTGVAFGSANNDIYVTNRYSEAASVMATQVAKDLAIAAPAYLTVYATSSSGTMIKYFLPVVSDPDDATLPVATRSQPSGSVFPVGVSTVNCSVKSCDDTRSTVATSFTIDVLGVKSQIRNLESYAIGVGPAKSLSSRIRSALSDLNSGNPKRAKSALLSFVHEVSAQSGK